MLKRNYSNGQAVAANPDSGAAFAAPGDPADLRRLWNVLCRRAGVVATTVLVAMAATVVVLMLIKPLYSATAVLLIDPRPQRVISTEAVLAGIGSDAAAVESQVEVIESPKLLMRVIARMGLDSDPEFIGRASLWSLIEGLARGADGSGMTEAEHRQLTALDNLRKQLNVRRRGLTYVLEVTVTSASPEKAARLADAIAEEYLAGQLEAKYRATKRASLWLGGRLEELREQVRQAERAVEQYKAAHHLVSVGSGENLLEQQIGEINQQMILARAKTAEAKAKYDEVRQAASGGGEATALPEALGSQVVTNLRTQFAEAARRAAELNSRYGAQHPSVVTARVQVADLQRQIDAEIGRILSGVRKEYDVAVGREASLEASLAELKTEAARWGDSMVRLRELDREAGALRSVYEQFLSRSKETMEQQSLQIADAEIIAPAIVPLRPSHPKKLLILATAGIGSLLLGLSLAFALEHLDRGFRSIEEIEAQLGLPCLGVIPLVGPEMPAAGETKGRSKAPGWLARLAARRAAPRARHGLARARPGALARFIAEQPLSAFAEAVRGVRVGLRIADRGHGARVLSIVSALPGEGKTTLAANLALALQAAGERVVLVDGDLRNPMLTRALAPQAPCGLVEVLRAGLPIERALLRDAQTGLPVLPAVRRGPLLDAAELLETNGFDRLLDELRAAFDLVIIDAAPLLPVADGRAIVDRADAALLVVEWAATDRGAVLEAVRALGGNADRLLGVTLSKVAVDTFRYYGTGRYVAGYQGE